MLIWRSCSLPVYRVTRRAQKPNCLYFPIIKTQVYLSPPFLPKSRKFTQCQPKLSPQGCSRHFRISLPTSCCSENDLSARGLSTSQLGQRAHLGKSWEFQLRFICSSIQGGAQLVYYWAFVSWNNWLWKCLLLLDVLWFLWVRNDLFLHCSRCILYFLYHWPHILYFDGIFFHFTF